MKSHTPVTSGKAPGAALFIKEAGPEVRPLRGHQERQLSSYLGTREGKESR